jgi:O-antigen ligase/polysaccharide polymerase Wzy-like membrane protein
MQRLAVLVSTAALLVGPTVMAFYAGGYFDGPRVAAGVIAWALVLLLAVAGPLPFPATRSGRVALAGLTGLAIWTALSVLWAPIAGPAMDAVERLLLYVAALLVGVAVLGDRRMSRAVEPVLALGALVAIGYGLAGRLLPGVVDLVAERSYGAGGRLEQPITYWNAEGLLAGMGLLLCARLIGDRSRPLAMRVAAAAACAPLGAGVYLSYSRGALAVAGLGLVVLVAVAPTWSQLRGVGVALVAGATAAACSSAFPGVATLTGTHGEQVRDGAIVLVLMLVVMAAAAALTWRAAQAESAGKARVSWLPHSRRLPAMAGAAAALCVVGLVAGGLTEKNGHREGGPASNASRYASVSSVRYEYWRVGAQAFVDNPVEGVGAGAFRVYWREHRRVPYAVTEVHSLPLEMAAELGLPGLLLFVVFVGGIAAAGRRALRQGAPLAPGAIAVCLAWLLHAGIDWDWQLPAVTLPALALAAGLIAASSTPIPRSAPADWMEARPHEEEPVTVAAR